MKNRSSDGQKSQSTIAIQKPNQTNHNDGDTGNINKIADSLESKKSKDEHWNLPVTNDKGKNGNGQQSLNRDEHRILPGSNGRFTKRMQANKRQLAKVDSTDRTQAKRRNLPESNDESRAQRRMDDSTRAGKCTEETGNEYK